MDEKDKIIADQGTKIVLIHHKLETIVSCIENIERSLSTLGSMDKTIITQQAILESQERRIAALEKETVDNRVFNLNLQSDYGNKIQLLRDQSLADRYTGQEGVMKKIDELMKVVDGRFKEKEDRIRILESWRWYVVGLMAAMGVILSGIPWKIAFQ